MANWPVHDAKAWFDELLATCLKEGPQFVTTRGREAAVLVPSDEWRRLHPVGKPGLKDLLLAPDPRGEIPVPPRGRLRFRTPDLPD